MYVDGVMHSLDDEINLKKTVKHDIELVIDRVLIDTVRKLPTKYKIKDGKTKYLFREIAHDILPEK